MLSSSPLPQDMLTEIIDDSLASLFNRVPLGKEIPQSQMRLFNGKFCSTRPVVSTISNSVTEALARQWRLAISSSTIFESPRLGKVSIREALPEDAEFIATLYESVEVTRNNITNYDRTGGFFRPLLQKEILLRITPGKFNIIVTTEENKILGFCTGSYKMSDDLSDLELCNSNEQTRFNHSSKSVLEAPKIGALLDVVSAPGYNAGGLATLMEYQALLQMRANHIPEMIFEIYNPTVMIDQEDYDLLLNGQIDISPSEAFSIISKSKKASWLNKKNIPSIKFHERMGAQKIGEKMVSVTKDGFVYFINADLFSFRSISKLLRTFTDKIDAILDGEESLVL